jgi:hypothetical protein
MFLAEVKIKSSMLLSHFDIFIMCKSLTHPRQKTSRYNSENFFVGATPTILFNKVGSSGNVKKKTDSVNLWCYLFIQHLNRILNNSRNLLLGNSPTISILRSRIKRHCYKRLHIVLIFVVTCLFNRILKNFITSTEI